MSEEQILKLVKEHFQEGGVREEDQRKVCEEYELTMDEDLRSKFEDWKKAEEEFARIQKGAMGTVIEED